MASCAETRRLYVGWFGRLEPIVSKVKLRTSSPLFERESVGQNVIRCFLLIHRTNAVHLACKLGRLTANKFNLESRKTWFSAVSFPRCRKIALFMTPTFDNLDNCPKRGVDLDTKYKYIYMWFLAPFVATSFIRLLHDHQATGQRNDGAEGAAGRTAIMPVSTLEGRERRPPSSVVVGDQPGG